MKNFKQTVVKLFLSAILVAFAASSHAQTENPRGIYKLMALKGKVEVKPYISDIYKIITDSVTMRLIISDKSVNRFKIDIPDFKPFNYTGERTVADDNDKSQQIYDSDSMRFTQKWWCTAREASPNHPIFPNNDWCYEFYESGSYSPVGKNLFNVINAVPADAKNPLIGTWKSLATIDNLPAQNAEEAIKQMQRVDNWKDVLKFLANTKESGFPFVEYFVFTPTHYVAALQPKQKFLVMGVCTGITYGENDSFTLDGDDQTYKIYWLLDGSIILRGQAGDKTLYRFFERLDDKQTLLSRISSNFIKLNNSQEK